MVLDEIAINNLKILSTYDKQKNLVTIKNKKQLFVHEKETDYESVNSLSDLEYPIYFSFHHLFTIYKKSNYNRKYLLYLMDDALCNIYIQFEDVLDDNNYIDTIRVLQQIDKVLTTITNRFHNYRCLYTINDIYDNCYNYFRNFLTEYKRNYSYYYYPLSSESDSDNESDEEPEKLETKHKFEYIMNWLYNTNTESIHKNE